MKKLLCLLVCFAVPVFAQKWEGIALTPPMGWNSWNTFAQHINEKVVRETAEAMIANGMRDAGYVYIVIDDTWSKKERDENGRADRVRRPAAGPLTAEGAPPPEQQRLPHVRSEPLILFGRAALTKITKQRRPSGLLFRHSAALTSHGQLQ